MLWVLDAEGETILHFRVVGRKRKASGTSSREDKLTILAIAVVWTLAAVVIAFLLALH